MGSAARQGEEGLWAVARGRGGASGDERGSGEEQDAAARQPAILRQEEGSRPMTRRGGGFRWEAPSRWVYNELGIRLG
jgi:hypothetical protein